MELTDVMLANINCAKASDLVAKLRLNDYSVS